MFQLPVQFKNVSWWTHAMFYAAWILFGLTLTCYGIFYLKTYLVEQKISGINQKIDVYGSVEQKSYERKLMDYKKKIDDFSAVIQNQAISSTVFSVIESAALPNVWFTSFNMDGSGGQMTLSGITENLDVFSRQVSEFERNTKYIRTVSVLNSQADPAGKILFTLNLALDPKIFSYQ